MPGYNKGVPITTLQDAEAAASSLGNPQLKKMAGSPSRMLRLMEFLGNPQDTFLAVHVAGTSGKTSTAYYCAALLEAAGYKVGLAVSPHVYRVNERVQINRVALPEADFCTALNEFLALIEPAKIPLGYFEVFAAFALWHFARLHLDYAVVEVGIGGLADATNVLHRPDKVCVITDIGLAHTALLGNSLGEIAAQKAGIIQPRNTVFCYCQDGEIMAPIEARAAAQHAELHALASAQLPVDVSFLPLFQQRNFALAAAAAGYITKRDGAGPLPTAALLQAAYALIPGRMEVHHRAGKTIVLDGAHNPPKMRALIASMRQAYSRHPVCVLFALMQKTASEAPDILAELQGFAAHIVFTDFPTDDSSHAAMPPADLLAIAQAQNLSAEAIPGPAQALQALLQRPEPVILATGSFYLLGHVLS